MNVHGDTNHATLMITVNGRQFIVGHTTAPGSMPIGEFIHKVRLVEEEMDEFNGRELEVLRARLAELIPGMVESRGLEFFPAAKEGRQS